MGCGADVPELPPVGADIRFGCAADDVEDLPLDDVGVGVLLLAILFELVLLLLQLLPLKLCEVTVVTDDEADDWIPLIDCIEGADGS